MRWSCFRSPRLSPRSHSSVSAPSRAFRRPFSARASSGRAPSWPPRRSSKLPAVRARPWPPSGRSGPIRQLGEDKTSPVTRGELIVMSDDAIFGQRPIRHFAFENPLLLRISRARYLNVSIVEADPGLGVLRPWLDGKGDLDWATGNAKLLEGDLLTVRGVAGPVDVAVAAEAGARSEARLRVTTNGPSRRFALPSRERGALAFQASPDAQGVLFRLRVEEGDATLTGFQFTPAAGGTP